MMNFSEEPTGSELNVSQWLLFENLNGPAIAVIGTIEFLASLILNLFIVVHAMCHRKDCVKKSSTFLLLILAVIDLLQTVLYMPFWIIASGAGEWLYGSTDRVRSIVCQIHAFIYVTSTASSLHILAIISLDRFLNIVKPHLHKQFMSWKTSAIILAVFFVTSIVLNLGPYYSHSIGEYGFIRRTGSCLPAYEGYSLLVWFHVIQAIIPLCIIAITSAGTFLFTHGFLKKKLERNKAILNKERFKEQKHIYAVRVKNLVGIFGSLMIFTTLSWGPYFIFSVTGLGVGFDAIPSFALISVFIVILLTNIFNPIIQIYFRKDLIDSLKNISSMCSIHFRCPSFKVRWSIKKRDCKDSICLDDDINRPVKIQYIRSFSAPVIKVELDSVRIVPNKMAESYSCGTMDCIAPADDFEEKHFLKQ